MTDGGAIYDPQTLVTSTETAVRAEIAWQGPSGGPRFESVIPLLYEGGPAFTLTYARADVARELAERPRVSLVFSDSRLARLGWSPLTVGARATVEPDPDGGRFREELLEQELRKHPPSRGLANSFMLQRENWWYLPRHIVRLTDLGEPRPAARRTERDHGLLAWSPRDGGPPEVLIVAANDRLADRVRLRPVDEGPLPEADAPATLFFHDFEVPEMERSAAFSAAGRLRNGILEVSRRHGAPELGARPGLLDRWRAWRSLERGCKRGLKDS